MFYMCGLVTVALIFENDQHCTHSTAACETGTAECIQCNYESVVQYEIWPNHVPCNDVAAFGLSYSGLSGYSSPLAEPCITATRQEYVAQS